jgi:type II restriction/modification system DNA methylase subunit YeeA
MPCRYYSEGEEKAIAQEESRRLKKELDLATRLLCRMLQEHGTSIEEHPSLSAELKEWKEKHDEQDKKRQEAEALTIAERDARMAEADRQRDLAESAKRKLSEEELEALRKEHR